MGSLRRTALVAALAIVSSALLPWAHAAQGHAGDCGVCSALTHGGARVAVAVAAPELPAARPCAQVDEVVAPPLPARRALGAHAARAPPASILPA